MADEEIHNNKLTYKTYVSRRIVNPLHGNLRIGSKVLDSEGYEYAKEKEELVLRKTPSGRKEIKVTFFEDDRHISVITIQSFNGKNGNPHPTSFSFIGLEIPLLLSFFQNISAVEFKDETGINVTDSNLKKLILSKEQAASLVQDNQDAFTEALRHQLTKEDVISLGYRKKQIGLFEKFLNDRKFFDQIKEQKSCTGDENLWQRFFEKNQWIFGYGLSYLFVTGFEDKKLEQIVQGHDLIHDGKRVDALMMTRGLINSLCFAEIKTHQTHLLDTVAYRSGCWAPSKELSGAVAQVQGTVASAIKNLSEKITLTDKSGNPTGEEIYSFKPKSFIVIGSLKEFVTENGINRDRLRSFEIFRNSIIGIDILTFDELYERSRFIVESALNIKESMIKNSSD